MPKPEFSRSASAVHAIDSAVYSPFAARTLARPGPVFPLHVGDTWLEPFGGAQLTVGAARAANAQRDAGVEAPRSVAQPGLHRYGPTEGLPQLRALLLDRLRKRGRSFEPEQLLVTAGATSGLACAISALADPGEEVLLLAPYWPLMRGITHAARARPVDVPFYDRVGVENADEALRALEARLSARSVALYFSSPSNPTGRVLDARLLEALADFARRHDLWLLSDEVYEDYVYRGEQRSISRFAPERTLTFHSFSKTYGMAGNRVGYLLTPEPWLCEAIHKVSVHSAYHAPTAAQWSALRALEGGDEWLTAARAHYAQAGAQVAEILGVAAPEGGCFLFVNAAAALDERGIMGVLEDCAEAGVLVAPGGGAGHDYESWLRLCFTAIPPEQACEAARRLARRLNLRRSGRPSG